MSQMTVEVVKIKCDVVDGNPHGFYECNADAVPDGAELFDAQPKRRGRKPKKLQDFVENEIIPALNDAQDRGVK